MPHTCCPSIGTCNSWLRAGLMSVLLLTGAAVARAAVEAPAEAFEETEAFQAGAAAGNLVVPPGASDRRSPTIVILRHGAGPDGRAGLYTDQLLDAGFAVLELVHLPADGLEAVVAALALHPRVAGLPVLIVTGYANTTLPAGIEVIGKPFDLGALVLRVRALLAPQQGGRVDVAPHG